MQTITNYGFLTLIQTFTMFANAPFHSQAPIILICPDVKHAM